ncbi:hypothetical protein D9758_013199 [Tetrapyrgos nigripes]|uniref:Dienelactone hydrolase domain-containing protein n=1 Tax=Tetrapyrgos nigripes TaxID=182062 RepID=A0A8H5CT92_9AGAR|nr:hypothetical protein D9758_013199 [Tetrapyrgos nigripes]
MSTSTVLAGPPDDCCFSRGVKHSGTPVGRRETIAGVPTYISEPPSEAQSDGKKVILFMSDIWGPFGNNAMLVQDYFAANGFHVVGLDYFFGDTVDKYDDQPNFDRFEFSKSKKQVADEAVPKWFTAIKAMYGQGPNTKYCAVGRSSVINAALDANAHCTSITTLEGYCFGAPYVMEWAKTKEIVAGAFAHPTLLTEDHFRNCKIPLLMSCAESDRTFPLPARRRAEDILIEAKAQYCIHVFSGVVHGFAMKADLSTGDGRWAKEESASSVLRWFMRFTTDESK